MLHMCFKLAKFAEKNWRRLRGFECLAKVIKGATFKDSEDVTKIDQLDDNPCFTVNSVKQTLRIFQFWTQEAGARFLRY